MDIELWKERKKQLKLTFEDLSKSTSLSVRTLKSLFSGERTNTTTFTVEAIEKALGINQAPKVILGGAFDIGTARIPLVGQVVAGIPVETSEYLESYITVDYPNPQEYFALRVNGDSMKNARIFPNDILVVHKQNYAENGDIVVASINGESTVKRYKVFGDNVFLMPENSAYEPIPITDKSNLFIFGKVVRIMADI